jgi:hypothetical protein
MVVLLQGKVNCFKEAPAAKQTINTYKGGGNELVLKISLSTVEAVTRVTASTVDNEISNTISQLSPTRNLQ